jgi:hypothetical protein
MKGGIYKIVNPIANAVYIGQTIDFERRWKEHLRELKQDSHSNSRLQELWNESSEECFLFEVISYSPQFENPLDIQKYLGLEEYLEIRNHKGSSAFVMNITSGEVVATQKAWREWLLIHNANEKKRIELVKKNHSKKAVKRRELEEYRDIARRVRFRNFQDLQKEIDKLYKKLAREGYFFKLFNLIPNDKEKQIIQSKITELTNKIEQTIEDKKTLKKFLDENNYEYKDLNNPHHVFDVYYKLKKDAYRLRNSKSELNVKNVEPEIPLHKDCPSVEEMEVAIYNIEDYLLESDRAKISAKVGKDILLLQRGYFNNHPIGCLGLAIVNYNNLFINGKHRTDRYLKKIRHVNEYYKYKFYFHLLEAKLLRDDKKQNDEIFLFHLIKASECPDVDTNVLSEISDFLEEVNSFEAKKLRLKILNILYETDSSLVNIYELGCLYLDGIGTEQNTIEGLRKLKSSFHYEDESVAFLIACTYLTDDTFKDIERSMVWYQIYKDSNSYEEFREEDIALLEDCYQKLDDDLREIIQGKAKFIVQLKEMRLKKHAGN